MPPVAPPTFASSLPLPLRVGKLLAHGRPDLRWPVVVAVVLALGTSGLPIMVGRHVSLTLPTIALVMTTMFWRGTRATLWMIALCISARLLVDDHDPFTSWRMEWWNVGMDLFACLLIVFVLHFLAKRERERTCLEHCDKIRTSEYRQRMVTQWTSIGLWDWNVGSHDIYLSPEWKSQLGYGPDEIEDRIVEWLSRIHPDDFVRTQKHLDDYSEGRVKSYDIEYRLRHRDGSWRWIHSRGDALRNEAGLPVRCLGCHIDITAHKETEAALRQSQSLLMAVTEGSPDCIYVKDRAGRYLMVNQAASRFLGQAAATIIGKDDTVLFPPDEAAEIMQRDQAIMNGGEMQTYEQLTTGPAGCVTFLSTKGPLRDNDGAVIGLFGISRDISARIRNFSTMQAREAHYRALLNNSVDGIHVLDGDGRTVETNDAFCRMLGYSREELLALSVFDWDARWTKEQMLERISAPHSIAPIFETKHRRKDGTIFDAEVSLACLLVNGGTVFYAAARDITMRKQLEAELAERMHELREAQRIAGIGSFTLHVPEGTWNYSDEMLRVLGVEAWYLRTVEGWAALIHPDDRSAMMSYVTDEVLAPKGKGCFDRMYRIIRQNDQAVRWLHGRAQVYHDAAGNPLVMRGSVQDVTDTESSARALSLAHARSFAAERATDQAIREERARVGRELHDNLAQQLAAAAMEAAVLSRKMTESGCEHAPNVQRVASQLRTAVDHSRQIARGLLSEVVPGDALADRLADLAATTQQMRGLRCDFVSDGPEPFLTSEQATHLFLLATEAVRNALAHAAASRVTIELCTDNTCVRLSISDDGRGPPDGPMRGDAMGRQIMAHRANLIGATYYFGAAPCRGTLVLCELPLAGCFLPPQTPS